MELLISFVSCAWNIVLSIYFLDLSHLILGYLTANIGHFCGPTTLQWFFQFWWASSCSNFRSPGSQPCINATSWQELDNSTRSREEKRPIIVYIPPQEEKVLGQIVSSCPKMNSEDSPSSIPSSDLEMGLELESESKEVNQQSAETSALIHPLQQMDWSVLVLGFCLTSATEIAMQSLQAKTQLPLSVHLASMAMVLAFACILMAKFVPSRFPNHAKGLEYAGIFCAATAFFLAITVAVPLCLKLISWSIYVLILLAIFIFHVLRLI